MCSVCALLAVRCVKTFSNYLGYVRSSCHAVGCDAPPSGHPAIYRAMTSIAKRGLSSARPRHFIGRSVVHNMVLGVDKQLEEKRFAMLWLIAYLFLLRLPSEVRSALHRFDFPCASFVHRPCHSALVQQRFRKHHPKRL